jgi:hypothetical protein
LGSVSLTEADLIQRVVEATPHDDIILLAQVSPSVLLHYMALPMLECLATRHGVSNTFFGL